ncbi:ABC transporter ATP-binding protein [Anaerolentibacter hominis]|uniref:ABC transporter ATP-binding protein n=1 Tax=Anaerolentibacter hominis TaxID=3079009 RepID=UPI0031B888F1
MIQVENLVKQYGDHYAVDHLSFTVEKGQILGFLGPNGAGKSTTMNIITGYISATEGTVTIDGHNILDEPEEAKKNIGYLPEIPPLYVDMTVKEYLLFVADLKRVPKAEKNRSVAEAMELTKITSYQNRLIKHLSKGYRQRTGIAGAMIGNPEIIILDEPTVGLDPNQIIEVRDLIKNLSKNHTVILSSHIMQEISAVCDMVMIINQGKLIARDTPKNLARHLSGTNSLDVSVKADEETVRNILASIAEIVSVETEPDEEEGLLYVHIYAQEDTDVREKVFYAFAGANVPIYGMNLREMSLEDVFIKLTTSMDGAEAKNLKDPEESGNEPEKEEA